MKLLVLGATGGTGLEIVRQAVERDHHVTAFVRSPERLKEFADRINVEQGNLLDSTQLKQVIPGHDAVLSAFGPRVPISKADAHLLHDFASALTDAMLHFPGIVADAAAMEGVVERSGLVWTIVRPPELTDKPYTGKYRVRQGHLPFLGFRISRADVADFMLKAVEDHSSIKRIVGVCN
jgi:putative NADH-flavin reductase